jgi:integrase
VARERRSIVSIRRKGRSWFVEVYDPQTKAKQHVKAVDYGMPTPKTERQARVLERAALNAQDSGRVGDEETIGCFSERWGVDYGRKRDESTIVHNDERVKEFVALHRERPIRSITRPEGREYGLAHPGAVPALRAMYNDAKRDGLVDDNPFAALGIEQTRGREDITVLTADEVDLLAEIALEECGPEWGLKISAMIKWAAYTCARTGETFAAKRSLLDGDTYHLRTQYNSRLRRETAPKHKSIGTLYVPPPAREVVAQLPREIGDDLLWRTVRGKQFKQSSWSPTWKVIRQLFMHELPAGHHLHQRLALDREDVFDFYELRHFGASYMLNVLGIEPWVIAQQLRHKDGGILVVKLYGHPTAATAIEKMRQSWGQNVKHLRGIDGGEKRRDLGGTA